MEWIKKIFFYLLISNFVFSQDSLESLLNPVNNDDEIVLATFFSTRIINSHSVEQGLHQESSHFSNDLITRKFQ